MVRIRTYDEAYAFIMKGRNKKDRPINHKHCRIHLRSEYFIEVVLYNTSIIQYYKSSSGVQTMSIDAWYYSQTTRRKIEQVTGLQTAWFADAPVLANTRYLTVDPNDDTDSYVWAGDSRYGKDHRFNYIADIQTRIRPDGSIVHEKRAIERLNKLARCLSVKSMNAVVQMARRATQKEWEHSAQENARLAELTALNEKKEQLLAEIGYLRGLKDASNSPDENILSGVHNRL